MYTVLTQRVCEPSWMELEQKHQQQGRENSQLCRKVDWMGAARA